MMKRGGEVVIKMLSNVQQVTIKPIIQQAVALGTLIYTDEYNIYQRLDQWGYEHKTVMAVENMPETKMVMGFMKFMSIPLKASGHSCALGLDPIEDFLRINCLSTWAFLSSSIMWEQEVKPFCHHCFSVFWLKSLESIKSLIFNVC